jgi:type I thyroxine 5'-deiodinase
MHERYKDQLEFLLIYIREAHPTDGWQVKRNIDEGVLLETAKNAEQKEEHATACVRKLDIRFATLIDGIDNKTEQDYAGWPDRLYLVGKDGRIAYKGRPGPAGFKPAELEAAIRQALDETR